MHHVRGSPRSDTTDACRRRRSTIASPAAAARSSAAASHASRRKVSDRRPSTPMRRHSQSGIVAHNFVGRRNRETVVARRGFTVPPHECVPRTSGLDRRDALLDGRGDREIEDRTEANHAQPAQPTMQRGDERVRREELAAIVAETHDVGACSMTMRDRVPTRTPAPKRRADRPARGASPGRRASSARDTTRRRRSGSRDRADRAPRDRRSEGRRAARECSTFGPRRPPT